jgi:nicotinamide-nucleotide amidase
MNKKVNSFVKNLKEKNLTLALAESITCGLAAHKLSTCQGTSEVLKGSIVCYSEDVKKKLMGVSKKTIDQYSCESSQVTKQLVLQLKKLIKANIHASLTGLASDGGSETKDKPVGTVFFCVSYRNRIFQERKLFRGSPTQIKEKACLELYNFINDIVSDHRKK